MSKAIKKKVHIALEYTDSYELDIALRKMQSELRSGKKYNRATYHSCLIEWSCTKDTEMEYREEVIDGKLCQIFQSKLNTKNK